MSGRPRAGAFDAALGNVRAPRRLDRAGRIELIGRAAQALLDGRLPDAEARLFVGGALMGWLESAAGDLVKDYLRITRPKSHLTPQRVWAQIVADKSLIGDERQEAPSLKDSASSPPAREE